MTKMAETVTNILFLSPTHFVSNIRHQHRCNLRFNFNLQRNISNTELNSLATIFDIKLSNKKCQKWAAGFLARNGTYEEQKMIFQTTRTLTSAED